MRVTKWPIVPILLLALTVLAAGVQAAVFGRDDRRPVGAQIPAQSIGTLARVGAAPFCTAFCVAADIIATAGHCLNGSDVAAAEDLARITFQLPKAGAQSRLAGSAIENEGQNVIAGADKLHTSPPIAAATDWAVAKLARPLCSGRVVRLSAGDNADLLDAARAGRIDQIAFHRDRQDADLAISRGCRSVAFADPNAVARHFTASGTLFFHDCDTGSGSSGSPMLARRSGSDAADVVAINVGTYVLSKGMVAAAGSATEPTSKPVANTAVRIAAVVPALTELQARELLESPTEIRRLELALKRLGYYRSPIIGRANATLMDAVRDFEMSKGRKPTGLLRRALLKETWDEMDR